MPQKNIQICSFYVIRTRFTHETHLLNYITAPYRAGVGRFLYVAGVCVFPNGTAVTEITLELGQIHSCFKTSRQKAKESPPCVAVDPQLDLQVGC